MKRVSKLGVLIAVLFVAVQAGAQFAKPQAYFPEKDTWERRTPEQVGMDASKLADAIAYARTQETGRPKDLSDQVRVFGRLLGPMPPDRGGVAGLVVRNGYIVAEFGDTSRVDPTYSVAKSYLSTILGLTIDRGMIRSVKDPVRQYIKDGGYDSPHNAKVTWEHHLTQTSEWEGTLFGKSHDFIGVAEFGEGRREPRALREPGSYYEYNDVRINRMSMSLLRLWKRPLPDVLKTEIMDPIGASSTWKYLGYANSDVDIDGKKLTSVSGGTRWGGGLWMNSFDHARFGYLVLRQGNWKGKQIISSQWLKSAVQSNPHGPDYGYLWWLNTQGKQWPDASRTSFSAVGAGNNTIWIDPEHDLVVVWRWHRGTANEFYKRIVQAVRQ